MEIYYWKEGTDRRIADKKRRTTGNPVRFLPFGILASGIRKEKRKAYMYRRIRERMIINMRVVGRVKRVGVERGRPR